MRAALCLVSAIALASCGSDTSGEFETEDGETGTYSIDEGDGETVATIKTDEGTAEMRSGENVPLDLPPGFSLFPGAKVVSNTTISHGDGKGSLVIFESDAEPKAIADYYRKQAETVGVEIGIEMSVNDGMMMAGEGKNGEAFTLNISSEDEGSTAQLMVGKDLGK